MQLFDRFQIQLDNTLKMSIETCPYQLQNRADDLTLVFKMPVYSRWDNSYFFSDGSKVQRADSVFANDIKRSFGDLILAIFSD